MATVTAPTVRRTRLHIHFKEENGVVSIEKVFAPGPGPGGENELHTGAAESNRYTYRRIVTVPGSTCVLCKNRRRVLF